MDNDQTRLPDEGPKSSLLSAGQIFGQYKVIRLLGRGGMGEVYEVAHTVLHRRYALKVIRPEVLSRPSAVERFRREAQVMNHLEHPHIVQVDDFGETEGHSWLRMPLLGKYVDSEGRFLQSLEDRMRGLEQIPEDEVCGYLEQILSALQYAHGKGAIHRDIKPSNILFDESGSLKIADFGLVHMAGEDWVQSQVKLTVARSQAHKTSSGQADPEATRLELCSSIQRTSTQAMLGTFEYMAPEQKRGEPADERSDLYAVGLIAFRMLTGQENPDFDMPSEIVLELNPTWDSWMKHAIANKAERRHPDAGSMLGALPSKTSVKTRRLHPETAEVVSTQLVGRRFGQRVISAVAMVFIGFGLISAILVIGNNEKAEPPAASDLLESPRVSKTLAGGSTEEPVSSNAVTLLASGNVYVLVRLKEDDAELYRKKMSEGESVTLEKSGPVDILFTAGEFLTIEHSGERIRPSTDGAAKITIP